MQNIIFLHFFLDWDAFCPILVLFLQPESEIACFHTYFYGKIFLWGKPRSKVKDARDTVLKLMADVKKQEQKALRFKDDFDTIARYCAATQRELEQLLDELPNEP